MRTGRIPPCSLLTTGSKSVRYISPRFMPGLFMSIFSFFNLYVIPQPRQSRAAAIYKADFSAKISVFSGVFMTLEYSLLAFLE